ncbi:MAG: beta-lactamase family protein [bacterium]|nr:beta-lactamase family protein [bacterium]
MRTKRVDKKRYAILTVIFLLALTASFREAALCSGVPQNITQLKSEIDVLCKKYKIPGASIALVTTDSIMTISTGCSDMKSGVPVTENTIFRTASITKSFLGLCFLNLVEEGKLDLDTPVRLIVPEIDIKNPWQDTAPVRVVHLLEHTSGFDEAHFYEFYNLNDSPEISLKEVLAISPGTRTVRWKPGTRMAYSNHGYLLAGYILEKVVKQRFEDFLEQKILIPIGMTVTSIRCTGAIKPLLAKGYGENGEPVLYKPLYLRPASSLKCSSREMALFVRFMLNRGKVGSDILISEAMLERMEVPATTSAAAAGFKVGYGIGNRPRFWNGLKYFGHGGSILGFTSVYAYNKVYGHGCAVLTNSNNYGYAAILKLALAYLARGIEVELEPGIRLPDSHLNKFTGYYQLHNSSEQLSAPVNILLAGTRITLKNNKLYKSGFMESESPLIAVSGNSFRRKGEPEATIVFLETGEGEKIMADPANYDEYVKTGAWRPVLYRSLVFGALIIMFSAVLYAFIWVPLYFYKRIRQRGELPGYPAMRVMPLLAVLSLFCGVIFFPSQATVEGAQKTVGNMVFFVSTLVFAGSSCISVVLAVVSFWKPVRMMARIYASVLSSACFGMTVYMWYWNLVGLRMWAY